MFKLRSVIYCNVLKEVSSAQQSCIYLYSKKYMPDSRSGSQKWPPSLIFSQKKFFFLFEKQDKTVKSTFWLFNLCNGEKMAKYMGGKNAKCSLFGLRPSVSFCSASAKKISFQCIPSFNKETVNSIEKFKNYESLPSLLQ